MRRPVDAPRLREFMRGLAGCEGRVYLLGGACGVLLGWHSETIDIDVSVEPEALLRPIADLKERLEVNVRVLTSRRRGPPPVHCTPLR